MSLKPIAAAALVLLSAGFARAQITPITSGLPDNSTNTGKRAHLTYEDLNFLDRKLKVKSALTLETKSKREKEKKVQVEKKLKANQ